MSDVRMSANRTSEERSSEERPAAQHLPAAHLPAERPPAERPPAERPPAERMILLAPGEVRPTRVPLPPFYAVKASRADTEGRLSVLEMTLVHDIPRHVHLHADECIYVLEGALEVEFEGRGQVVKEGSFVLLPHGVPHALRRAGDLPPRLLQISAPGGFEAMVEDLVAAGPAVLKKGGGLDPAALTAIGLPHGIDYGV